MGFPVIAWFLSLLASLCFIFAEKQARPYTRQGHDCG
jgi:hypothetical protein